MTEMTITTNKMNHLIDPVLSIWGWEIPIYLFLGGLTAGILVVSALVILSGRKKTLPFSVTPLAMIGPVALSLGMLALFLDLEHKLYVWRFYFTFRPTSPMSWGAWILLLVYPLNILIVLGTLRENLPSWFHFARTHVKKTKFLSHFDQLIAWSEKHLQTIAALTLPVGVALGIYTGILLSSFAARPFWNDSILGPLFLVSGISTTLALVLLFTKSEEEYTFFSHMDIFAIIFEIMLLALFIVNMSSSALIKQQAISLFLGGPLTHQFWIFVMGIGLLLPLGLEFLELKGIHVPKKLPPLLVLFGGLMFRFVMVQAGQLSTWVPY